MNPAPTPDFYVLRVREQIRYLRDYDRSKSVLIWTVNGREAKAFKSEEEAKAYILSEDLALEGLVITPLYSDD